MYMECTVLSPHYTAPEAWGQLLKKSLNLFWDDAIVIELSPVQELEVSQKNQSIFINVCLGDVRSVSDLLFKAASDYGSNSLSSLLEAQNADEQTALHLACRCGSAELVEAILEYEEANVDVLDKDGDPPLAYALAAGSPECVRSLQKSGYEGESILHRAVPKKSADCALVILENGGNGSIAILNPRICLKYRFPINFLLKLKCLPNLSISLGLQRFNQQSFVILVPYSIEFLIGERIGANFAFCGADPSARHSQHGRTALHTAVMTDDVKLVKVILAAGVDVNIRNVHNGIPLHIALARGAKSCVELLLCIGADCNLQSPVHCSQPLRHRDDDGNTALHIAAGTAK
ncbi:hypothetical protein JHK87_043336 [Glycine soja]|nr:hypothetical protein JHK87_043336 [Glycine soja]